jgi:hypothetical protein
MNGLRKPRVPRPQLVPINRAIMGATRFTQAELSDLLKPVQALTRVMCEGVATEEQYLALRTFLDIALHIERGRHATGTAGHFLQALHAMDAIAERARAHGAWKHSTPQFHEIDALREAVQLHEHQLRRISAGALHTLVEGFARRFNLEFQRVELAEIGLEGMA